MRMRVRVRVRMRMRVRVRVRVRVRIRRWPQDEKGAKRVWIAGGKADDGKRFCTFNITTRAVGIEGKPRRGQPKMSVT